jgi:hypothetical protein
LATPISIWGNSLLSLQPLSRPLQAISGEPAMDAIDCDAMKDSFRVEGVAEVVQYFSTMAISRSA